MIIGACEIELTIPRSNSLKEKRRVIKSIIERIRKKYNVSIAEIDRYNNWKSATLGISCVGNEKSFVNKQISKVINVIENSPDIILVNYNLEIF
jgi:hypothetical protein